MAVQAGHPEGGAQVAVQAGHPEGGAQVDFLEFIGFEFFELIRD